ncbi:tyrosine-type recombinase/integrase [Kitasatospora sp. NPDC004745]|uniref:tyrosine-type recombinase/integrase n=1 Tax=Kitasatospora sp. NPDC004745 TaxID=3364019 RepID=UPI00369878B8
MWAWLIQAMTGRRASEVLMVDFEPLSDIPGLDAAAGVEGGMVARLRYQQTKIDAAPNTILVGRDVVEIVREQQAWVREHWHLGPVDTIRYLFPKTTGNRHGTKSWETSNYNRVLKDFSHHLDLRDSRGELLLYSRSHRLRHTKATTLINVGAPIHVVQRYLGHHSPEVTMRYAATLASTAEREFLALAKVGGDGRELAWTAGTCWTWSSSIAAPTGSCPTATASCRPPAPAAGAMPATAAITSPATAPSSPTSSANSPRPSHWSHPGRPDTPTATGSR